MEIPKFKSYLEAIVFTNKCWALTHQPDEIISVKDFNTGFVGNVTKSAVRKVLNEYCDLLENGKIYLDINLNKIQLIWDSENHEPLRRSEK